MPFPKYEILLCAINIFKERPLSVQIESMIGRAVLHVLLLVNLSWTTCSGTKSCSNPPPALMVMTRGVDITKLDLLPEDTTVSNGISRSIIQLTCDEGKTWTSPYSPGFTYDMPDQVETINALPSGVQDATYNVYRDYRDAKTTMSANLGIELINGMLSASSSYKSIQHAITNSSKIVSTVAAHFSAMHVEFAPYREENLLGSVQAFIKRRLPDTFNVNNTDRFYEFIQRFGTHSFVSGKFGSHFKVNIKIEESLAKLMAESDLKVNAEGTFVNMLKTNGSYHGTTNVVTEEYQNKSQVTSRFFGGHINQLVTSSWATCWPTMLGNPWLFGGSLEKITNLLEEGPKRTALEAAMQVYLDKAYLGELQRSLIAYELKGHVGGARARQFYEEAATLLKQEIPDHSAITTLGISVEDFLIVPDWFLKNTQLCYDWFADEDAGQCTGPSRTLCAAPDHMTAYYRDDSDRRAGGCQMRWGLNSTGAAPDWFTANVKMCYRWNSDVAGDQCGGAAPRQTCAHCGQAAPRETCGSVGNYTVWYRDNTDRRPGGCQMSWRLQVPEDAPGWMLNTKMCFRWFAEDDGGQCGGGADRNLCAVANQWTPYYLDDTDSRGGGCQMAWGLMV